MVSESHGSCPLDATCTYHHISAILIQGEKRKCPIAPVRVTETSIPAPAPWGTSTDLWSRFYCSCSGKRAGRMATSWPPSCAKHAFTDAEIEVSALYRTLRQLEQNDCVTSEWDVKGSGPARRLYKLTPRGEEHLEEWITVLAHMTESMSRFVREARSQSAAADSKREATRLPRRSQTHADAERATG